MATSNVIESTKPAAEVKPEVKEVSSVKPSYKGRYANEADSMNSFATGILKLSQAHANKLSHSLECDLGRLEAAQNREVTIGKVSKDGKVNIKEIALLKKTTLTFAIAVFRVQQLAKDCADLGVKFDAGTVGKNLLEWLNEKPAKPEAPAE